MIMEDPEWFMMFDKPRYSINHTHKFEWLWSTTGGLMFIFFPSPSIGSYDAWWFTARHEWQPQLMSSTLASGFFLTFIWMQLDMYYPWNPLRSSCYLSIYIHIICWYVYDIFTCQTFIEKLVIELINLSFSTYPFIYWRRACCLNHNFKSQYLLENLGLFYTKTLNPARFYASKRDTWHKSERALPEAEGRRGPPEDRLNSWHGKTHWTLRRERWYIDIRWYK